MMAEYDLKFAVGQIVRVKDIGPWVRGGPVTGTFPAAGRAMLDDIPPIHYYRVKLPEPYGYMEFREDDIEAAPP